LQNFAMDTAAASDACIGGSGSSGSSGSSGGSPRVAKPMICFTKRCRRRWRHRRQRRQRRQQGAAARRGQAGLDGHRPHRAYRPSCAAFAPTDLSLFNASPGLVAAAAACTLNLTQPPHPLLISSPVALALSPLALTSPLPPQFPKLCFFHRRRPSSRCRLGPRLCCGVPRRGCRRRPSSLSCRLSSRSFACFTAAGQAPVAGGGSGSGEKWPVPHSTVNKPSSVHACLRAWQST
jgi:hypothetical protein